MIALSCEQGLEGFLVKELEGHGFKGEVLKPSKVVVQGSFEDAVYLNLALRIPSHVYLLIGRASCDSLEEVEGFVKSVAHKLKPFLAGSFAVRADRYGQHEFTSVDVARVVGAVVKSQYPSLKVDLDNPGVVLKAELSGDDFLLMIDTTGRSLHKRYPKPFQHFAPLKTGIAAALIDASRFSEESNLLDPMAGGGTIPIKAYMKATNTPPCAFREEYAFQRSPLFHPSLEQAFREELESSVKECAARITAADLNARSVEGLRRNAEAVSARLRVFQGDAARLDYLAKGEHSVIVTNPPYGLRLGSPARTAELHEAFVKKAAEKGVSNLVLFMPRKRHVQALLESFGFNVKVSEVLYGKLWTKLIVAEQ